MAVEYVRATGRVLLIDDRDRLLLMQIYHNYHKPASGHFWITAGGGIDAGETPTVAAVRELREETGLVIGEAELGAHVAYASGYAHLSWAEGIFRDDFFMHRVDRHDVDMSGLAPYEMRHMLGHRWWSVDEIAGSDETIYPWGLAPLLRRILDGDVPASPVELPWHH